MTGELTEFRALDGLDIKTEKVNTYGGLGVTRYFNPRDGYLALLFLALEKADSASCMRMSFG